jgi:hypothetical protein
MTAGASVSKAPPVGGTGGARLAYSWGGAPSYSDHGAMPPVAGVREGGTPGPAIDMIDAATLKGGDLTVL